MTVLEFISHLEWGVSVHISKFAPNYYAKSVRVEELEKEEYSEWHELKVVDWCFSRGGVCYLEVQDV